MRYGVAFSVLGLLFGTACSSGSGTPQGSGQTGSIGSEPNECKAASDCAERNANELAALNQPASGSTRFDGAACIQLGIVGGPSGPACECQVAGSDGTLAIGPVGGDCYVTGRGGDCLWQGDDFKGCVVDEADACTQICADLQQRLADDATNTFDASLEYSSCEGQECHSVVRIGERCYADGSYREPRDYDCALGGEAILAAHARATHPPEKPLIPDTRGSYVAGTDGFVRIISSRSFVGHSERYSGFGADAQFATISGAPGGQYGDVIDPLEGLDDCGVVKESGVGAAPNIDMYDAERVILKDGAVERPLSLSSASHDDFYQYIAELDAQGVEPRYGQSYGVLVEGGSFGSAFRSDSLRLPPALAIHELEQASHFGQEELRLTWSGQGEAPLYLSLWVSKSPGDLANAYQIQCLLEDDGEFVIPAQVLQAAPSGFVSASFTREDRHIEKSGTHSLLLVGSVEVSHQFALGPTCDHTDVAAACAASAERVRAAYQACNLTPPTVAELCPDFLTTSCDSCPEYFDCVAQTTRCTAQGFYLASGCSCPSL